MHLPKKLRTILLFFFLIILFFLGIKYVFPLLTPFLLGLVIAYLIESPVRWIERKMKLPRWLAVSVTILITLLLAGLLLTIFFSRVYTEIKDLLTYLPDKLVALGREVDRIQEKIKERFQLPAGLWENLRIRPETMLETTRGLLQEALNLLTRFPFFLFNLFLSGLTAYFLSKDKEKLASFALSLLAEDWRQPAIRLYRDIVLSGLGFLRAQLLLVLITTLLTTFLLGITGFARSGLIGLVVGVLDLLPMIGPSAFFLPWAGWMFVAGKPGTGVLLVIILLVVLGVRQLAEVRLIGRNLGLHPLAALLSVYLGIRLFGMYGFIIGPIFIVMMRSFYHGILPLLEAESIDRR